MSRLVRARQAAAFATGLYGQRWDRWYAGRFRGDDLARLRLREGRRDPYPIYEEMRARGPMAGTRLGDWATTSHAVSKHVLRSRAFGVSEPGDVDRPAPGTASEEFDLSFLGLNPPTTPGCDASPDRRLAPG